MLKTTATVRRATPVCDHCKKKAATRFCDLRLDDQQGEHRKVGGVNLCEECWPKWRPPPPPVNNTWD